MKKILSFFLLCAILTGLLSACGGTPAAETAAPTPGVKLWYAYNTENFMQDFDYAEKAEGRDCILRMHGIRGDVESAQLMVTPENYVEEFHFEVKDLVNENGDKISKNKIDVFYEWYVTIEQMYNPNSYYGNYPDALVPAKALKRERLNTIEAGENQGIWINVNIPENTKPGFYTGFGVLELDDEEYEIPIELTVYDAVMPEEVHAQSCFLIWYDKISIGEGSYSQQLGDTYFWFLVEKRCMPMHPVPQISNDYDAYIDWLVKNAAENPKISCYTLPKQWEQTEQGGVVSRDAAMRLLTKMAQKNIELRQAGNETIDLFKKAYFYTHDEPSGNALQLVKISDQIISECKFAVADEYLKDYPDLYNSLAGVGHLVTTGYSEDLLGTDTKGGLQTWCPQFQHWHTEEQRQQYYDRQNTTDRLMGEEAWWYGCNNPRAPFPTYHLDDDLISSRVLSWMQYDYGCDGNLYWCVNTYTKDMWETPTVFDSSNGEGNLMYPGKRFNLTTPISTLRLESVRESMEDFEYFWMIEQAILKYNAENGTNHDPKSLMAPLYDGLYEGMIPERGNSDQFAQRRITVLQLLEQLQTDPAAGIGRMEEMGKS